MMPFFILSGNTIVNDISFSHNSPSTLPEDSVSFVFKYTQKPTIDFDPSLSFHLLFPLPGTLGWQQAYIHNLHRGAWMLPSEEAAAGTHWEEEIQYASCSTLDSRLLTGLINSVSFIVCHNSLGSKDSLNLSSIKYCKWYLMNIQ